MRVHAGGVLAPPEKTGGGLLSLVFQVFDDVWQVCLLFIDP